VTRRVIPTAQVKLSPYALNQYFQHVPFTLKDADTADNRCVIEVRTI
jgi:hypothetical protein